jgi:type I restriction enzyme S subunit
MPDHNYFSNLALRSATERTITLLKERRSALIAATVTGKIDLRESVA